MHKAGDCRHVPRVQVGEDVTPESPQVGTGFGERLTGQASGMSADASAVDDPIEPSAVIIACEDGPLLVRGEFAIRTQGGEPIDPRRGTVALCRCGRSGIRPFCDGTHKLVGFRAPSGREGAESSR